MGKLLGGKPLWLLLQHGQVLLITIVYCGKFGKAGRPERGCSWNRKDVLGAEKLTSLGTHWAGSITSAYTLPEQSQSAHQHRQQLRQQCLLKGLWTHRNSQHILVDKYLGGGEGTFQSGQYSKNMSKKIR